MMKRHNGMQAQENDRRRRSIKCSLDPQVMLLLFSWFSSSSFLEAECIAWRMASTRHLQSHSRFSMFIELDAWEPSCAQVDHHMITSESEASKSLLLSLFQQFPISSVADGSHCGEFTHSHELQPASQQQLPVVLHFPFQA